LVALLAAGARVGGASTSLKAPVLRSQAVDLALLGSSRRSSPIAASATRRPIIP